MNTLYGYELVVSPIIKDAPKIEFRLFQSSPKVQAFNQWLGEMFGWSATAYLLNGDTLFVSASTYAAIKREAMKNGGSS